jgi:hypothetical protein
MVGVLKLSEDIPVYGIAQYLFVNIVKTKMGLYLGYN